MQENKEANYSASMPSEDSGRLKDEVKHLVQALQEQIALNTTLANQQNHLREELEKLQTVSANHAKLECQIQQQEIFELAKSWVETNLLNFLGKYEKYEMVISAEDEKRVLAAKAPKEVWARKTQEDDKRKIIWQAQVLRAIESMISSSTLFTRFLNYKYIAFYEEKITKDSLDQKVNSYKYLHGAMTLCTLATSDWCFNYFCVEAIANGAINYLQRRLTGICSGLTNFNELLRRQLASIPKANRFQDENATSIDNTNLALKEVSIPQLDSLITNKQTVEALKSKLEILRIINHEFEIKNCDLANKLKVANEKYESLKIINKKLEKGLNTIADLSQDLNLNQNCSSVAANFVLCINLIISAREKLGHRMYKYSNTSFYSQWEPNRNILYILKFSQIITSIFDITAHQSPPAIFAKFEELLRLMFLDKIDYDCLPDLSSMFRIYTYVDRYSEHNNLNEYVCKIAKNL